MVETVEWNQALTGQWIVQRNCASFLFPSRRLMTVGASDVLRAGGPRGTIRQCLFGMSWGVVDPEPG